MTFFQESKCIETEYDNQLLDEETEQLIKDKYKSNPAFRKMLDALLEVWSEKS